ncbi:MAG: redoxin domain-containing protein [Marmoricola sp.]|nr:redoxin domain-containing protein [Marmoricola sp.]
MLTLALIGLVGGLITGVSPCVLPMLPIIFVTAGEPGGPSAGGGPRGGTASRGRPLKIIGGVVVAFSLIALVGSSVLSALGLPDSFLRWTGLVVLTLVGLGLIVPPLGHLIEKPFYRLPKLTNNEAGPFVLGLGLGTLYVPCAGPVLAAITVAGATGHVGVRTVVLTVAFAVGAALPLLVFAAAGSRIAERVRAYRKRDRQFRIGSGVVLIALAVGLAFNLTDLLQRAVPDYTSGLQSKVAGSSQVQGALNPLSSAVNAQLSKCTPGSADLTRCGQAPPIRGISHWFNTPGGRPVPLTSLRGHVVLVDFWAYSCINCQRNQPYLNAWYRAYHAAGLDVVGVQSPEFSFEKSVSNVQGAVDREHIAYPVALDPRLETWTNYRNQYWPATYVVDAHGTVRAIKFGEGGYEQTESQLRTLLREADPGVQLPAPTSRGVRADQPGGAGTTPETYLAYSRGSDSYRGSPSTFTLGQPATYALRADQPADTFSLGGRWRVGTDASTALADGAQVRIDERAAKVYNVVSGHGTITVSGAGGSSRTVRVDGQPNAYPILDGTHASRQTLTLTYSTGLKVYTFSFG